MVLCRDLINALVLDIKFSGNTIIGGEGPYEEFSASKFELSNYDFTSLMENMVKPEESFINLYVEKCLKLESIIRSTRRMHRILDTKYEESDLNKVIIEKCQHFSPRKLEICLNIKKK